MELKGKQLTLGAKVLAAIVVLVAFALLGLGIFDARSVSTTDIVMVGLFIAFIFGPVDVSLMVKTFMENLPSRRIPGCTLEETHDFRTPPPDGNHHHGPVEKHPETTP